LKLVVKSNICIGLLTHHFSETKIRNLITASTPIIQNQLRHKNNEHSTRIIFQTLVHVNREESPSQGREHSKGWRTCGNIMSISFHKRVLTTKICLLTHSLAVNKCTCSVMKASKACDRKRNTMIRWVQKNYIRHKAVRSVDLPQMACLRVHSRCGLDPIFAALLRCLWME
jgi:hypothetical protein